MAEEQDTTTRSAAAPWITGGGVLLIAVGVLGAGLLWSDMSSNDFGDPDYSSVETTLAVLSALGVAGLGLIAAALGAILARLD